MSLLVRMLHRNILLMAVNLSDDTKSIWSTDEKVLMHGRFWDGSEVDFVAASNPTLVVSV